MNVTVAVLLAVVLGDSPTEAFFLAVFLGWLFNSLDLFGDRS